MTQLLKLIEGKDENAAIAIIQGLCADGILKAYSYCIWDDASIFVFFNEEDSEVTMLWFQYLPDKKNGAVLQQCISNQLKGFYEAFLKTYPLCNFVKKQGKGEIYLEMEDYNIGDYLKSKFRASSI